MNQITKKELSAALSILGPIPEMEDPHFDHEHDGDCMVVETIEITSFSTPDIDNSYEREIYVCSVTGEDIPLDERDPVEDRIDALNDMHQDDLRGK